MEKTKYKGWPNCYRLSNDLVDLIVTTDVGPRIIRFGFLDERNEFYEKEQDLGKTAGDDWRVYGGHRLWHSPEVIPRTYFPDNSSVRIEQHDQFVRLIQGVETTTGIQKEIDICLQPDKAQVKVVHRLRNTNVWPVRLAPWALTVMAPGGRAIMPLPPRGSQPDNLLRLSSVTLWGFTDMGDPRWTWGSEYVLLRQIQEVQTPQKVGVMAPDGWIAYARDGRLFVKKFVYIQEAIYPDLGCSVEAYTNGDFLEIETLAPLTDLQPEAAVEHVEHWFLFRDTPVPSNDADVNRDVLPRVRSV